MNKEYQIKMNEVVDKIYADVINDMADGVQHIARLRTCSAEVLASNHYYLLRSYSTIIAAIPADGMCYDFLRKVYGYTATSAQHIHKFARDYGHGHIATWREV